MSDTKRPAPRGLAELIEPIDVESFERDHWDRRPLLVRRSEPDFFSGLLTLRDVDAVIGMSSLRAPELLVVENGKSRPAAELLPGGRGRRSGFEPIYERYRHGATLVLVSLEERWAPLGKLATALAAEMTATVWANAYLTPAGSQGFAAHYDTHDVFVAQVHGSKHWRLYESPVAHPLRDQHFTVPADGCGEPVEEFDLQTGDVMYLPRGTVHSAASNDEASLHLTIGVGPVVWATAIQYAIGQAALREPGLREALPLGFARDAARQTHTEVRLAELADELLTRLPVRDVVARAARASSARMQPELTGHLGDLEAVRSTELGTPLRRRDGLLWTLANEGDAACLEFNGKTMRLPARLTEELGFITAAREFTPGDIPGSLDHAGRIVLVNTLMREGFLTLVR